MVSPAVAPTVRRRQKKNPGSLSVSLFVAFLCTLCFIFLVSKSPLEEPDLGHGRTTHFPKEESPHDEKVSTSKPDDLNAECLQAVKHLQKLDIRLLALDFDMTIVDIHTGGHYRHSHKELATHVRPHTKCLMEVAKARGLQVAIATFSRQTELIQQALGIVIPGGSRVIVRGGNNRSERTGKLSQLQEIGEVLALSDITILPSQTLLIDDDPNNVRTARDDGYFSLLIDPHHVETLFQSILSLNEEQSLA